MPLMEPDAVPVDAPSNDLPDRLPFPPITYSHILNCSYHSWHPRYFNLKTPTLGYDSNVAA